MFFSEFLQISHDSNLYVEGIERHFERDVLMPRTKTNMGDRVFHVADAHIWSSLPATIQQTKTLPAFKKQLKLYLIGNPEHLINCADSEHSSEAS